MRGAADINVIEIFGYGAEIEYVSIAKSDVEKLTSGVSDIDIYGYFSLPSAVSVMGGMNRHCDLYFNGKKVRKIAVNPKLHASRGLAVDADYILLNVRNQKGRWEVNHVDAAIRPEDLLITVSKIAFQDSVSFELIDLDCDGSCWKFDYVETKGGEVYILDRRGKRYEVKVDGWGEPASDVSPEAVWPFPVQNSASSRIER